MPLSGKVSQAGSAPLARSGDAGEWTLRLSILFESERVLSNGFPPISANLPRYAAPETALMVAKYRNCSRPEAEGAACHGNENDQPSRQCRRRRSVRIRLGRGEAQARSARQQQVARGRPAPGAWTVARRNHE